MLLPRCPVCETITYVRRVKGDWFRCHCGSIWKKRGFSQHQEEKAGFEKKIGIAVEYWEMISSIPCRNCNKKNIIMMPEGYEDIIYICANCDTVHSEEWINQKVEEIECQIIHLPIKKTG